MVSNEVIKETHLLKQNEILNGNLKYFQLVNRKNVNRNLEELCNFEN
jgi:hypothetical protein